ncbi:MAG: LamG-like jellyroll fold domain-containing protein [Planctomycetota bacterium]
MCRRSIVSISFVFALCLGGNALAEDLAPPEFAGADGWCAAVWEFEVEPPEPTGFAYNPALPEPEFLIDGIVGGWWEPLDQALAPAGEGRFYLPAPEADGGVMTMNIQITWEGDGDVWAFPEVWSAPDDEGGEYFGGNEGIDPEIIDLGDGIYHGTWYGAVDSVGEYVVALIGGEGVTFQELVVDAIIHDGDPPAGTGQRPGGPAEPELARNPEPGDGDDYVLRDVELSWMPGDFAVTHNVYFGTAFDDVNEADTNSALLVSPGQTDSAYVPAKILDWGQEYFWRVDEVNDADPNSPWKGHTWSFTVEPYAYPLDPEEGQLLADDITVSGSEVDSWPDATVWDGLDGDEHSIEGWAMWLSDIDPNGAWIEYPFDRPYKLSEILIWNYNEDIEPILGFGFNETVIEYSADEGETFVELATVNLNQAPGEPTGPTDTLDLQGVVATNLRLTAKSNFSGGFEDQFGLSAVRILYLPVRAMDPVPAPEEVVDLDDLVLEWRAGRGATSHKVYFGTNEEELAPVETTTETGYEPSGLALDQEYFWRVDEVDDPLLAGNIWSFVTKDHLVVDDMEGYEDLADADDPEVAIFRTWADGWLHPTNGSVVGDEFGATEKEITHDESDQSMPFSYENTGDAVTSEATRTFDEAQDWTRSDVKALTLYVHGSEDNVGGQMYVKINGVEQAVAVDLADHSWQEVNIALADFAGVNLESVASLTIGIRGANSTGTAYIDNIRLYPSRCLAGTDLQGDINGDCIVDEEDLAIITDNWLNTPMHAEYTFDTDLSDTSGNDRTGVDVNSPAVQGGVLTLDGTNFVDIPLGADNPFDGSQDFSIALDFQTQMPSLLFSSARDDTPDNHAMSIFVHNWDEPDWGEVIYDQFYIGAAGSEDNPLDGQWHSVVVTYSAADELIRVYLEGEPGWDGEWNPEIPDIADDTVRIGGSLNSVYPYDEGVGDLVGSIDNVRIFSFVLSGDDVAGLANGILPEHPTDLNGDGIVDQADKDIVEASLGAESVWP